MKLDEAIEVLQKDIADPGSVAIENVQEAERLGIEALKRIKEQKKKQPIFAGTLYPDGRMRLEDEDMTFVQPLPGETK